MPGSGARGQNLEHFQNVVFLCKSFLEVHILTTTYQKAIGIYCRVGFHSMAKDPRVHAQGWARGQNLVHSRGTKVGDMLTLAPKRYTAGLGMVTKIIQWCI